MLKLKVNLRHATLESSELITSGSVGMKIQFEFSSEWDGLSRTAIFSNGVKAKCSILSDDNICLIPPECLEIPGRKLIVGIYGTNGDDIVIPTVFRPLGRIEYGTNLHADPSVPPTPDIVDQIIVIANNAQSIAQSVRDDADAGLFDGKPGEKGEPGTSDYTDVIPISEIEDYLFEANYLNIDYDNAKAYFESMEDNIFFNHAAGACSSVRNGNYYGRKLDWFYNNQPEFIVRVPAVNGRYASIGIAGAIRGITNDFAKTHTQDALYKLIPFHTQDGINEYGLVVSTNVVPLDKDENDSIPTENLIDTVNGIMLVRYILDHFKTAFDAVDFIRKHVSVWFSKSLHAQGYEQHYMLADSEHTYSLEFVNNEAVYKEISPIPYMTNFYLDGVIFNDDGKVYTPETLQNGSPEVNNRITEHGSGLERWNYIVDNYSSSETISGMRALMNGLNYTKAYITAPIVSDPYWYTEFVNGPLHCGSSVEDFSSAVQTAGEYYRTRSRDSGLTWQSVHSVIYDIRNRSLYVIAQENGIELSFSLNEASKRIASLEELVKEIQIDSQDKYYTYQQYQAASVWRIKHNLEKYPSVSITDSSGNHVIGDVSYIDMSELLVTFSSPFAGRAYLN